MAIFKNAISQFYKTRLTVSPSRIYLHDRLSEILGAPITQARLEGGTDVVPVTAWIVTLPAAGLVAAAFYYLGFWMK